MNRQKPFTDVLRVALLSGGGRRLRVIAEKLVEKAEEGDLQAIREVIDRLDGKATQPIERGDVQLQDMTDQQLLAIARGGLPETLAYSSDCGDPQNGGRCPVQWWKPLPPSCWLDHTANKNNKATECYHFATQLGSAAQYWFTRKR